jgi:hypothetical protein
MNNDVVLSVGIILIVVLIGLISFLSRLEKTLKYKEMRRNKYKRF